MTALKLRYGLRRWMAEYIIKQADLTNCDREPIHIPGAILPHGAMFFIDPITLRVLQVAGDTETLYGIRGDNLLGLSLDSLLQPGQVDMLRKVNIIHTLAKSRHFLDPALRFVQDQGLDC